MYSIRHYFPRVRLCDNLKIGNGLNYIAEALSTARAQGWISDETAAKYLFKMMGEEIDIHEELSKVQAQQKTKPNDTLLGHKRAHKIQA